MHTFIICGLLIVRAMGQGGDGGGGGGDGGDGGGGGSDDSSGREVGWSSVICLSFIMGSLMTCLCVSEYIKSESRRVKKYINQALTKSDQYEPLSSKTQEWLAMHDHILLTFKGIFSGTSRLNNGDHPQTLQITINSMANELASISGSGSDEFGQSIIAGQMIPAIGIMAWVKTYKAYPVIYHGRLVEQEDQLVISGDWSIDHDTYQHDEGTFSLRLDK